MNNILNEEDLTTQQSPKPDDDADSGLQIPNTEKFTATLERFIEAFEESPLPSKQAIEIVSFVEALIHEARMSGFKAGYDFGMALAQELEDDPDYVRVDGKYARI